jgi:hypothetical protein
MALHGILASLPEYKDLSSFQLFMCAAFGHHEAIVIDQLHHAASRCSSGGAAVPDAQQKTHHLTILSQIGSGASTRTTRCPF